MIVAATEKASEYRKQGWWGDLTLDQMLTRNAVAHPDRLAIVDAPNRQQLAFDEPRRMTYSALLEEVHALAIKLQENGVGKKDIVIAQMPNISEFVSLYFACSAIGAIISPIPVQYRVHELTIIANKLKPRAFICCTVMKGGSSLDFAPAILDPDCRLMTFGPGAPDGAVDLSDNALGDEKPLMEFQAANPVDADDIFSICWTSGTTGAPKGVPRSHNQWAAIAPATYDAANLQDGDLLLNPFPMINMASIGGLLMSWLHVAGTMILHHPFDPTIFLRQIQIEKPTFTVAPPAILNMLLQNEGLLNQTDLSSLRTIASGSAPLAPAMVRGFQERFDITVINLFGSNEGMSLVSGGNDVPDPEQRASFFPCAPLFTPPYANDPKRHMASRIIDLESGNEIAEDGQSGELHISGPTVFEGYFESPEETAQAFTDDGYFRTGDLFQYADNGRFFKFVGRCKDLIIRGGVNIAPEELDQLLGGHPDLVETCTFAIPDAILGERVAVAIVAKANTEIPLETVTGYLKDQGIAVFKLPEKLFRFDDLPRNALNKIDKNAVRKRALLVLQLETAGDG